MIRSISRAAVFILVPGVIIMAACEDGPTAAVEGEPAPEFGNTTSSGNYVGIPLPGSATFCVGDPATLVKGEGRLNVQLQTDANGVQHVNVHLWSTNVVYESETSVYNFKWNEKLDALGTDVKSFVLVTSVKRKSDGKILGVQTTFQADGYLGDLGGIDFAAPGFSAVVCD